MFNRESAEKYLYENVRNPNLLKHMYSVEQVLRSYATALKSGEVKLNNTLNEKLEDIDIELWALTGLHQNDFSCV